MCLNDQYLKHMNDKIRARFMPNHLFQVMKLVNWLSVYKTNIRMFTQALNKLAMPADPEGNEDGYNNGSE
jgi:hypothetical protein